MASEPGLAPLVLPEEWRTVHIDHIERRAPRWVPASTIQVDSPMIAHLSRRRPDGIYLHQAEAIRRSLQGEHVCLATGTGSGKTLAFTAVALHHLLSDPEARVIALYPMKALAQEQQERWVAELVAAGLSQNTLGVVVGGVSEAERRTILERARVVVMTPDVMHAWMMRNLNDRNVRRFLKNLRLVVVDEVHTYTGVFGSNAAMLFRRLRYAVEVLGGSPSFFVASATIKDPTGHAAQLLGRDVSVIGEEDDTSARGGTTIQMVELEDPEKLLQTALQLITHLLAHTTLRFIAFTDSRKMVEYLSVMLDRQAGDEADQAAPEDSDDQTEADDDAGVLGREVLPYRSGYENSDRKRIQERLTTGQLRGVVSTSALELGLDIPNLDVVVLIGVPSSGTSLRQRIGRVGRTSPGLVVVLRGDNSTDTAVFADPSSLMRRPLTEGALYLGNQYLQCVHAICLADRGRELDQLHDGVDILSIHGELQSGVVWPEGFGPLLLAVRNGSLPPDLLSLQQESADSPHLRFPLRDIGSQFQLKLANGPQSGAQLGSIALSQALREAYPGAIYYHMGTPYRVRKVSFKKHEMTVQRVKRGTFTTPLYIPTMIYPGFGAGSVIRATRYDDAYVVESELRVSEAVKGFKERRGSREVALEYPLKGDHDHLFYDNAYFNRTYRTTGVVVHHPAFNSSPGVEGVGHALFEALLVLSGLERGDLEPAVGSYRGHSDYLTDNDRFCAVYDRAEGSLRLSGRLADTEVARRAVGLGIELVVEQPALVARPTDTLALLALLAQSLSHDPVTLFVGELDGFEVADGKVRVVAPGSVGQSIRGEGKAFHVQKVFVHPKLGLVYRGYFAGSPGKLEVLPTKEVGELPGESTFAWYDPEVGDVV